jgi:hypothetical protein
MQPAILARSVSISLLASLCTVAMCQCPTALVPWVVGGTSGTGWASSSSVTVYIVSSGGSFSPTQESEIMTAFGNWNSTLGCGIDFDESLVTSMPSVSSGYAEVVFGTTDCGEDAVGCTSIAVYSNGQTEWSQTIIATSGIDSDEFLPLIAHEVGHTYGIDDCAGCSYTVTIMSDDSLNSSDPTSPLCCDQMLMYDMTVGTYGTYSCGSGGSC